MTLERKGFNIEKVNGGFIVEKGEKFNYESKHLMSVTSPTRMVFTEYVDVVKAMREYFEEEGLTAKEKAAAEMFEVEKKDQHHCWICELSVNWVTNPFILGKIGSGISPVFCGNAHLQQYKAEQEQKENNNAEEES